MIGATFCSGIGAPEVAAPWVDWRLASEIEPFPRAVLQERFGYRLPEDHNQGDPLLWGDMTEVTPDLLRSRGIPLPDLIVAGTPCQDFSVAGLRAGLSGDRGNLTLSFVEICHAIVDARPDGKLAVLWENVPGVLSDRGNAFGCFLGGLVGAMDALPPPADGSWPCEGMVQGPRARAAWAVLDAQWFGVAQRRRRVFVVVDFGNCVDPAAVLLEPDRLRGDSPPRRETGQDLAISSSLRAQSQSSHRLDSEAFVADLITSTGDVAHCLNAGGMGRQDYETETMIAHTLKGEGFDGSEDGSGRGTPIVPVAFDCKGTEVQYSTDGSHPTLRSMSHSNSHQNAGGHAAVAIQERAVSENPNAGPQGKGWQEGVGYTLEARHHVQAVAFDMRGRDGGAMPEGPHDTANIRAASGGSSRSYVAQQISISKRNETLYGVGISRNGDTDACAQEAHTTSILRAMRQEVGEEAFAQWGLGILDPLQSAEVLRSAMHGGRFHWAVQCPQGREGIQIAGEEDQVAGGLRAVRGVGSDGRSSSRPQPDEQRSEQLGAYLQKLSLAGAQFEAGLLSLRQAAEGIPALLEALSAVQETRRSISREGQSEYATWAVRRLTPRECARLQGFPDDHTAIIYRGKLAADGPQYKSFGNSMAVPVVRWIMDRMRISMEAAE